MKLEWIWSEHFVLFTHFGVTTGITQGFRVIPEVTPKWVTTSNTNVHSKFTLISLFTKIHSLKSEHIHSFLFREYTLSLHHARLMRDLFVNSWTQPWHQIGQILCWGVVKSASLFHPWSNFKQWKALYNVHILTSRRHPSTVETRHKETWYNKILDNNNCLLWSQWINLILFVFVLFID